MTKLTKEQREEIIELRKQGKSIRELSVNYGVSYAYVYNITHDTIPEGKCRYCGNKVANYGTICSACHQKKPLVKELLALANLIKKKAGR